MEDIQPAKSSFYLFFSLLPLSSLSTDTLCFCLLACPLTHFPFTLLFIQLPTSLPAHLPACFPAPLLPCLPPSLPTVLPSCCLACPLACLPVYLPIYLLYFPLTLFPMQLTTLSPILFACTLYFYSVIYLFFFYFYFYFIFGTILKCLIITHSISFYYLCTSIISLSPLF